MKFVSPLIAVKDIAASRKFYEDLFDLTVEFDFGRNLSFVGGLSLQQDFDWLTGIDPESIVYQPHCFELYFEADDLDAFQTRLDARPDIRLLHGIRAYDWGQRVLRLYDPDGHIIEVGERMEDAVKRFLREGMTIDQVAERSMMPRAFIEKLQSEL